MTSWIWFESLAGPREHCMIGRILPLVTVAFGILWAVQAPWRTAWAPIPLAVRTPVSPSVALSELPEQTVVEPWAEFLKYAMVDDDIVIVDPIRMRVADAR